MKSLRHWILLLTCLLITACEPAGDENSVEGDEAGECSDGVDNDQDGNTDCNDDGCINAIDCTSIGDDDATPADDDDDDDDDDD
ncbi:MAG: hypothetical protein CL928_17700, partial [Deltaproteobacteria bacterium]|nr:hypothetical protein [Deltaproteobacteria bacterium]